MCVSVQASAEGVYDDPRTYELAFGFREFEKEAHFMSALSERMGTGRPMTSLLELGAGPAWHSTATATALPGAVAVAVDNAAPMLARARERVAHAKLTDRVAVVEGDMTSLDATAVIEEATKMNTDAARGEFILITVWAIRMTSCFVYRNQRDVIGLAVRDGDAVDAIAGLGGEHKHSRVCHRVFERGGLVQRRHRSKADARSEGHYPRVTVRAGEYILFLYLRIISVWQLD